MKDVRSMSVCSIFVVLIAVGAFIKVPISIVPITLQTLFVVTAACLLGKKKASISVLIYIIMGLVGLPIFAHGGGFAYVLQPTFGYLLGFLVAAYVVGALCARYPSYRGQIGASLVGVIIIYCFGMTYFVCVQYLYYGLTFEMWWIVCYLFLVYLPGDIVSCLCAVALATRLKKVESIRSTLQNTR